MLTRDAWLERATGAYQQLSGCSDEEAEQWKNEWEDIEIDVENDCLVTTAEQVYREECAEPSDDADGVAVAQAGNG